MCLRGLRPGLFFLYSEGKIDMTAGQAFTQNDRVESAARENLRPVSVKTWTLHTVLAGSGIICVRVGRNKMTRHERTERHQSKYEHWLAISSEKETKNIQHQETIDCLNDVFPSFSWKPDNKTTSGTMIAKCQPSSKQKSQKS